MRPESIEPRGNLSVPVPEESSGGKGSGNNWRQGLGDTRRISCCILGTVDALEVKAENSQYANFTAPGNPVNSLVEKDQGELGACSQGLSKRMLTANVTVSSDQTKCSPMFIPLLFGQ